MCVEHAGKNVMEDNVRSAIIFVKDVLSRNQLQGDDDDDEENK